MKNTLKQLKVSKENFLKLKTNYKKTLQGADVANPEINPTFFKEYKEKIAKKKIITTILLKEINEFKQ